MSAAAGRKASGGQRDHCAALGVEPAASAGQLTSAYRRPVRALLPDASPGTAPGPGEPAVGGRLADAVAGRPWWQWTIRPGGPALSVRITRFTADRYPPAWSRPGGHGARRTRQDV
ncbi:hypothetical protein GCM10010446_31710 [Streptomyces enissocaesilis]|uniref:Uncharacterized protein n=1 Tax=Streptomyces enissocaesilis TaxID=332589 RepID=A0ABP6JRI1_9ACTN